MSRRALVVLSLALLTPAIVARPGASQMVTDQERIDCRALEGITNLTILSAEVRHDPEAGVAYCYVRGVLPPAIGFHVQLPLRSAWNGRFLKWGDGGKDGSLNFADHRVAEGYAVANSNMGHDNGAEPGSSFAYHNRQAEIDFGHRAVHLTTEAGKRIVAAYYGRAPEYSYFEGCSTGGREGLMEAQRYPYDFDGIVAGAPAHLYQDLNAARTWFLQRMYLDGFAGSLSFDADRDGLPDSVRKLELLQERVLEMCDELDGIADGVIDNPPECRFDPDRDLADMMCPGDEDGDGCFTRLQLQHVKDFYRGAYDSQGHSVYWGLTPGSEDQWIRYYVPTERNRLRAGSLALTADHLNYLFYETDPGVAPRDLADVEQVIDPTRMPPEWAWWDFDIDDVTRGKGDFMKAITDANDPDLSRLLLGQGAKLIMFHGWSDGLIMPGGTVDYYDRMVDATFGGDLARAREHARLFMFPGMGHCSGGPGPNTFDRLAPLVEWVERGVAPESIVATHRTDGVIDNERPIYAYPDRTVYTGPAGGQNDPANWVAENFSRR